MRERELPDIGYIELEDPETGEQLLVNTSDRQFRERYNTLVTESDAALAAGFSRAGIGTVPLLTSEPYEIPLKRFFRGLKKGRRTNGRIL